MTKYQTQPKRSYEESSTSKRVIGYLSVAAAIWAAYEVLGIGNIFGYIGLSNDDAAAKAAEDMLLTIFDPIGFMILVSLLVVTIIFFVAARTPVTKGSLIATALFFVLSFFRVSMIFPLIFTGLGSATAIVANDPDIRAPATEEYALDPAQLVRYQGDEGVRVVTAFANISDEHWESATLVLTYSDAAGAACGSYEHVERLIAPQERVEVASEFLAATSRYADPSCVPVTATAELTTIDIDSRTGGAEPDPRPQRSAMPELASLSISEEPLIAGGVVMLSVTGSVDPAAVEGLRGPNGQAQLPMAFELVNHEGLRLAWCFKPEEVQPDGSFVTRQYHSPVEPGLYASVAVVPEC